MEQCGIIQFITNEQQEATGATPTNEDLLKQIGEPEQITETLKITAIVKTDFQKSQNSRKNRPDLDLNHKQQKQEGLGDNGEVLQQQRDGCISESQLHRADGGATENPDTLKLIQQEQEISNCELQSQDFQQQGVEHLEGEINCGVEEGIMFIMEQGDERVQQGTATQFETGTIQFQIDH